MRKKSMFLASALLSYAPVKLVVGGVCETTFQDLELPALAETIGGDLEVGGKLTFEQKAKLFALAPNILRMRDSFVVKNKRNDLLEFDLITIDHDSIPATHDNFVFVEDKSSTDKRLIIISMPDRIYLKLANPREHLPNPKNGGIYSETVVFDGGLVFDQVYSVNVQPGPDSDSWITLRETILNKASYQEIKKICRISAVGLDKSELSEVLKKALHPFRVLISL